MLNPLHGQKNNYLRKQIHVYGVAQNARTIAIVFRLCQGNGTSHEPFFKTTCIFFLTNPDGFVFPRCAKATQTSCQGAESERWRFIESFLYPAQARRDAGQDFATPLRLNDPILAPLQEQGSNVQQICDGHLGSMDGYGGEVSERSGRRMKNDQRFNTTSRTTLPLGPNAFCGFPFSSACTPPAFPRVIVNWSCAFHWAFSPGRNKAS